METEFLQATGKSTGEVLRDIADFLSTPFPINEEKQLDLCTLLPDLNMHEQLCFALLSEAEEQQWPTDAAENFCRHALSSVTEAAVYEAMFEAFRNKKDGAYALYKKKYGADFGFLDSSYWSTCLALGIDAQQVGAVMQYLRLFTVLLTEFAYMGDRNPSSTYGWRYYETFRRLLDDLTKEPEPEALPLKVRSLGGTLGKRENESYTLFLGLDLENPNPNRMACDISIDICLKDSNGNVITTIADRINFLDPATVYHYGITKKIRGATVASFSATAKATAFLKLENPMMKHFQMDGLRLKRQADRTLCLAGELVSKYDRPLRSVTVHYQLLSAENKILGGGCEWFLEGLTPHAPQPFNIRIPVPVANAAKVVYSADFDALELLDD